MNNYKDEVLDAIIDWYKDEINRLEIGTAERSRAVDDLKKLLEIRESRRINVELRMDKEHEDYIAFEKEEAEKEQARKLEEEAKKLEEERKKSERKDKIWKRIIDAAQIFGSILSVIAMIVFTWFGLKMEYNQGNATSFTLKNCLKSLTNRK